MRIILSFFFISLFVITSCSVNNTVVVGGSRESKPIPTTESPKLETPPRIQPVSTVELVHGVKHSDTTIMSEIVCTDSVLFTQVLAKINVSQLCIEYGIEGKTYFSATTNRDGKFEEVNVLKSLGDCSNEFETKIKEKILTMRALSKEYGNTEFLFYHKLRYL